MELPQEKTIRLVFVVSLFFKGAYAALETLGGAVLFFVSTGTIYFLTQWLTLAEITEDPHDLVANYLIHSAQDFTTSSKTFIAMYLLLHGIVKLFLVIGLIKNKLWAYPASLIIFGLFIAYQLYRFTLTQSLFLIALTAFDLVVMWLIWHEYVVIKRQA